MRNTDNFIRDMSLDGMDIEQITAVLRLSLWAEEAYLAAGSDWEDKAKQCDELRHRIMCRRKDMMLWPEAS